MWQPLLFLHIEYTMYGNVSTLYFVIFKNILEVLYGRTTIETEEVIRESD